MENIGNISDAPYFINPYTESSNNQLKIRCYGKHICGVCNKDFKQSGHLDTHIKLKHCDAKPYHCNHLGCNKSFAVRWALRTHMKTHEEKRFCCNYCDKKFHQKAQMETHIKYNHFGMSYKCEICNKHFPNHYLLKYHCRTHNK
jgi:uncharacterized Zn-finger protein